MRKQSSTLSSEAVHKTAETARALHATGAKIFLAVRDTEKAQSVAQDIEGNSNAQQIEVIKLHLDSLASVREAAQTFLSKHEKLNILINNAGNGPDVCLNDIIIWLSLFS